MADSVFETENSGLQIVLKHRKYQPTEAELVVYIENCGVPFAELKAKNRHEEELQESSASNNELGSEVVFTGAEDEVSKGVGQESQMSLLKRYKAFHRASEESLLKIARNAWKSPLPKDTTLCRTEGGPEAGEVYFFDFRTGESSWLHPDAKLHAGILRKAQTRMATKEEIFKRLFVLAPEGSTASRTSPLSPPKSDRLKSSPKATTAAHPSYADPSADLSDFSIEDDAVNQIVNLPPVPADLGEGRWERLLTPRGTRMFLANLETGEVVQALHPSASSNSGSVTSSRQKRRNRRQLREAVARAGVGGDSGEETPQILPKQHLNTRNGSSANEVADPLSPLNPSSPHPQGVDHPLRVHKGVLLGMETRTTSHTAGSDSLVTAFLDDQSKSSTVEHAFEDEEDEEEDEFEDELSNTFEETASSSGSRLSGTIFKPEEAEVEEGGTMQIGQQEVLTGRGHTDPTDSELEDYASWLGIHRCAKESGSQDSDEEDLMWIALEGLTQPCPRPWKLVKDTDSSQTYYFNFETGESAWDHPLDGYYRALVNSERERKVCLEKAGAVPPKAQLEQFDPDIPVMAQTAEASKKQTVQFLPLVFVAITALSIGIGIGIQISRRSTL